MDSFDAPTFDPAKTNPLSSATLIPESLYGNFGKYRIIEKIGQGGMGAVYLAEDPLLERQVAIKVPLLDSQDRATTLGRFSREAVAAAALRHPSICPIFEFSEYSGIPFIVTPFLHGRSLQDHLEDDGVWSVERMLRLGISLANALDYAHRHNVVHRDIKPQNILIESEGTPIILDFGLAKVHHSIQMQWTQTGEIVGTPSYMPPEQIDPKCGTVGPASDIYALGMTLYRIVTGRTAFAGDAQFVIPQILLDSPRLPSELYPANSDIKYVDSLLMKALEKSPANRPRSMGEFSTQMQNALLQLDQTPTQVTSLLPDLRILGSGERYHPSPMQKSIRIGRQKSHANNPMSIANDLVIRATGNQDQSLRISRQHLEIVHSALGLGVIDRSQAGISINGIAAKKGEIVPLKFGDIISVAGVIEIEIIRPTESIPALHHGPQAGSAFEATMGDLYRDGPG